MSDARTIWSAEVQRGRVVERGRPRLFAHECGYRPGCTAVTEARYFDALSPLGYSALLRAGYRRFGELFFRPHCLHCTRCISYRIVVPEVRLARRWRRVLRRNQGLRVEVGEARADREAVDLANAFHRFRTRTRGWEETVYDHESYARLFCTGPVRGLEARLFADGRLVGVSLFDDLPDGGSAVIFFYDEGFCRHSPGAFNVLWQLGRAQSRGGRHLYLGFLVPGCRSTAYKADFRPAEVLLGGRWRPLPEGAYPLPQARLETPPLLLTSSPTVPWGPGS